MDETAEGATFHPIQPPSAGKTPMKATPVRALLTAKEVMSSPPITVPASAGLREVAKILDENEISGAPVIDEQERPIGVVSRTDLIRLLIEGGPGRQPDANFLDLITADSPSELSVDVEEMGTAEEFMSPDPVTVPLDEPLAKIARRMADERVHRVIVVDKDRRVMGVVTTLDLLAKFPA
jgi:CBS domain-containing protein